MKKRRICWITGDYFIDVDMLLVPYLQEHCPSWQIDWYVIRTSGSRIQISINTPTKVYQLKYRGKDPRIIWNYYKMFDDMQISQSDIIYSDFLGVPYYYGVLLHYNNGVPVVHAAHNIIPYKGWPNKKLMKWYVNYSFKHLKYVHIFSKYLERYFCSHFSGKEILICPMTVKGYGEVTTNNYTIDPSKLNLLFFGNIKENKRLDLLIDAVKSLSIEEQNRIHLTIAGKCDNTKRYLDQIGECNCISTFFKRIDDQEIPELFTKHQFLVLPYEDVAQSGPQMIACFYDTPVISTDIDGFRESIIDGVNGFLFKVNNKKSLSLVIMKASRMSQFEYEDMRKNVHNYVQNNYNLEVISAKYINYFNKILK